MHKLTTFQIENLKSSQKRRHEWQYTIKVNIKLGCKSVDLIQLAQYKAQFSEYTQMSVYPEPSPRCNFPS